MGQLRLWDVLSKKIDRLLGGQNMQRLKVWLVNEGENLPGDDNNPRLQRMGLLAYELEKLGPKVVWWQSTFNHYQKKFRYYEDKDIKLTNNLEMKLIHSCGYKKNVSIKRMFHEWKTAKRFYQKAKNEELPDVIVSAMPTIAQAHFTVKFGREHNIPVIVDLRDLNPDVFVSPFHGVMQIIVSMGIKPLRKMLSNALKNADGLVGTTEPYLNWGLNYAKRDKRKNDRVYYVSYPDNGVVSQISENSRWREYENYPGTICCFFGQFGQLVDFNTLIEAAQLCQNANLDIEFLLCGKGQYLEHYRNIVKEKGIKNVRFPGWVNQTDIADIGCISDIGLMSYKKNDNFDMQMPNKFSEYLALGLVIMLQPTGVMLDVITENRCGLHYENAEELFEALKEISHDKTRLEKMKNNSRKLFEREFAVNTVYREYGQYILNMAREKK